MGTIIIILPLLALTLVLYARTFNGKGPSAGVTGILLTVLAGIILLCDALLLAFFLGKYYGNQ